MNYYRPQKTEGGFLIGIVSAIILIVEAVSITQPITCAQCGGELHPDEGQIFIICPYCSSAIYLDKSRVVFHWYLASTLDETKARAALQRWMAGNQTVKDLDKKATITGSAFEYFPVWYFKHRQPASQKDTVYLKPAAATSITEIKNIKLPAGDLRKYDSALDAEATSPSVPLQTALTWLAEDHVPGNEIAEQSLVHIPVFTYKYTFKGDSYTAIVEAGTGEVFANIYPAKAELPYRTIGCITALIFVVLAIIPLIGAGMQGPTGTGIGLAICVGLGIIFVPLLFGIAAYIAAKV
jgi:DNA-directed RNA polymerase subunit RPC12/RpoP